MTMLWIGGSLLAMFATAYLSFMVVMRCLGVWTAFSGRGTAALQERGSAADLFLHALCLAAVVWLCASFAPGLMESVYIGFGLTAFALAMLLGIDVYEKRALRASPAAGADPARSRCAADEQQRQRSSDFAFDDVTNDTK